MSTSVVSKNFMRVQKLFRSNAIKFEFWNGFHCGPEQRTSFQWIVVRQDDLKLAEQILAFGFADFKPMPAYFQKFKPVEELGVSTLTSDLK